MGQVLAIHVVALRLRGVNPVIPRALAMPVSVPVHPSRYYCHTRLIYLAMATLYAERFRAEVTPFVSHSVRSSIHPGSIGSIQSRAQGASRQGSLSKKPSVALGVSYEVLGVIERIRSLASRRSFSQSFARPCDGI